ncbi:MAG TPA: pyruvate dehydrogenase (acetyl-transferring) E1 component subunit alpha [Nitrospiria bacterium]|jgi:pyruvate dehydrogenase E1 component alpha subunit
MAQHLQKFPKEELIKMYRDMLLIRRFEEKSAEMYALGKIGGFCHLYIGQEAVAVGAMAAIREDDYVLTAYRDHGHALAKGSDPKAIMAELFGKETGVSKGKGGSMHLFDVKRNFLGGYAIVGGHIGLAVGVGFAINYQKHDQVVLCFFGEGAVNSGMFHEALNMAALWKLPVIFICENNRYGMGTPVERASSLYDISQTACAYEMKRDQVDGMDVLEIRDHVKKAVDVARDKHLPTFLEARTYRFMGHSMSDPSHGHYRTKEEIDEQKKRDPILLLQKKLIRDKIVDPSQFKQIEKEVQTEVTESVNFSEKSAFPPESSLEEDVFS